MKRNNVVNNEYRRLRKGATKIPAQRRSTFNQPRHDEDEINELAISEGWLTPPAEVTRAALKPWQQTIFWALRAYIVVMLIVMAVGFSRSAGS
ncbi:MAG: hypothetical protein POG74_12295 [Acidocella sp.]|nr:hypothetical protein [Acidocella sp.]